MGTNAVLEAVSWLSDRRLENMQTVFDEFIGTEEGRKLCFGLFKFCQHALGVRLALEVFGDFEGLFNDDS